MTTTKRTTRQRTQPSAEALPPPDTITPKPETSATHAGVEPAPSSPGTSKIAMVGTMLRRDGGATLTELAAATGWLPHTMRAALTGLRKKGHAIAKGDRDGVTAYSIAVA